MSETDDTNSTEDPAKTNAEPTNDPAKTEEKTFTQDEVSKMMGKLSAKETNQGRNAALKDLGIDPKDTATIDEIKKFVQSKKPEAQVLAEKELELQNKIRDAEQRAFTAEVKATIMQSGANPEYIDDITALVTARGTDSDNLTETVEAVKTKYPAFFAQGQSAGASPPLLKGTGSPIKAGAGGSTPKQDDLGKRLAEQRKSGSVASNHWGS